MALTVSGIKAIIKNKREAQFGTPDNAAEADKAYQADAELLHEILTTLAVVQLNNGVDSGGDSLLDTTGTLT